LSRQKEREFPLRSLARACGDLTATSQLEFKGWSAEKTSKTLGDLMAQLAVVARYFSLGLSSVARENLRKIKDRWPGTNPNYVPLFDETGCESYERLPRAFEIEFVPRKVGGRQVVVQRWGQVNIGDPLTDNSHLPDGYRYHDVFHFSYVAHLGWSPVIRALLKLKRKSDAKTDENEDGARAVIIEEGIATWIFNHAKERNFYEGLEEGRLDFSLLKQVRSMVRGYEVDRCPLWQWERAIPRGFKVSNKRENHTRGWVKIDMLLHTLEFRPYNGPVV